MKPYAAGLGPLSPGVGWVVAVVQMGIKAFNGPTPTVNMKYKTKLNQRVRCHSCNPLCNLHMTKASRNTYLDQFSPISGVQLLRRERPLRAFLNFSAKITKDWIPLFRALGRETHAEATRAQLVDQRIRDCRCNHPATARSRLAVAQGLMDGSSPRWTFGHDANRN